MTRSRTTSASEGPAPPKRPAIPASLYCLVALLAGEMLVLRGTPERLVLMAGVLACAILAVGGLALCRGHGRAGGLLLAVAALAAALGMGSAAARLSLDDAGVEQLAASAVSRYELVVTGDPSPAQRGWRQRASVRVEGRALCDVWLSTTDALQLGDHLRCVGRFKPNEDDEWGISNRAQGLVGTISCKRIVEHMHDPGLVGLLMNLRSRTVAAIAPERSAGRAVVAGSVCGDRAQMKQTGVEDTFAACGVSHLVAVSGGHIAIVASLIEAVLSRTRLRPAARMLLLMGLSGCFVIFTGLAISAVRSWLMVSARLVGELARRRLDGLSATSLVCLAMAALDPACSGSMSFLLSALSVIGLCLFAPYAAYVVDVLVRLPRRLRHVRLLAKAADSLGEALASTLVCQIVTLPVTVDTFGTLSLVAPLANVLLSLPFSLLIGAGLAGACLQWMPVVPDLMFGVAAITGDASVWMLERLESFPYASIPLAWELPLTAAVVLAVCVALIVWWPCLTRQLLVRAGLVPLVVAAALFVRLRWLAPARVVILDVGQGDAILVQDGGHALLVDAGPAGNLSEALARQGVLHLDGVLITHLHDDHYGGLEDLASGIGADRVIVGEGVSDELPAAVAEAVDGASAADPVVAAYGDVIRVGGFVLRVVSPLAATDGSENEDSVELRGSYEGGGKSLDFLLTGDAEHEETGGAVARQDVGDIDLLKVGHHGSKISIDAADAQAIDAELAVASCGEGNSYGHPSAECVETLERAGSAFLATKDVGDVDVRPGRDGFSCRCGQGWL